MQQQVNTRTIFMGTISYARKDTFLAAELKKNLTPLQQEGLVYSWDDLVVDSEGNQSLEIDRVVEEQSTEKNLQLRFVHLILLLLSADFLNTDFAYSTEMKLAIERHEQRRALVVPIILRPASWSNTPFSDLEKLPVHINPVTMWPRREDAWKEVVQKTRQMIENFQVKPSDAVTFTGTTKENFLQPILHNDFDVNQFVNRDSELHFINEQCLTSLKENRFGPQFVEFNGSWGIGKTTMLRRIEYHCSQELIPTIWIEANEPLDQLLRSLIDQVCNRYGLDFISIGGDPLDELFEVIRTLLQHYSATVILIDSLEAAQEEQLLRIEELINRFVAHKKLLFIMASSRIIDFKNYIFMRRRLRFFSLKSFSRDSCFRYIKTQTNELTKEEMEQIFLFTSGYPIALNIAVKMIKQENLNLTDEHTCKRLMQVINEQVIEQGILATFHQDADQLLWYQTMLSLFAIPRRFNLTIMQKMIEKFAVQYKLSYILAYMSLQQRINFNTGLLDWSEARTGYAIEAPVRHLLLVKWRVEDREQYVQIHNFLMEENWRLAMQLSGADRVRYIQEYLYHSAFCLDDKKIQDNVDRAIKHILSSTIDSLQLNDSLLQFAEEYKKDEELQEALGSYKDKVLTAIYKFFADSYWDLVPVPWNKEERISNLVSYVFYTISDPTVVVSDRLPHVRQCVQLVKAKEAADVYRGFLEALSQDPKIKELLGDDPQTWNLE